MAGVAGRVGQTNHAGYARPPPASAQCWVPTPSSPQMALPVKRQQRHVRSDAGDIALHQVPASIEGGNQPLEPS